MANKFPIAYHEGTSAAYKNVKFNLYTESNAHKYASDDALDFYVFNETAAADSPQQAFVLFVIKNTGSANSMLDLDGIEIVTTATGNNNPFSIIQSYGTIGSTGTTGLSTITHAAFHNAYSSETGYVQLDPAPLGYVRINEAETTINNQGSSFGDTGNETFIPFYATNDIIATGNQIGASEENYGSGPTTYPHYAAIMLKCDPAVPLEILAGDIVLQFTQSTGTQINIDLVMESFNEGAIQYQQGFINRDAAGDPEFATDNFTTHPSGTISPVAAVSGPDGTINENDLVNPSITNIPDASITDGIVNSFFLGYWPDGFNYLSKNLLFGGSSTQAATDRIPALKITDSTATGGGIQFQANDTAYKSGTILDLGTGTYPPGFSAGQLTDSIRLVKKTSNTFNFNFSDYNTFNGAINFGSSDIYYLWINPNIFQGNYLSGISDLGDADFATFMNGTKLDGSAAWEAKIAAYPFYHKPYYINTTNSAPTKRDIIQIIYANYQPLSANPIHRSRLFKYATGVSSSQTYTYSPGTLPEYNASNSPHDDKARGTDSTMFFMYMRHSYFRGIQSSTISGVTKDKEFSGTMANPTTPSTNGGTKTMNKHLHIKDYFVMPAGQTDSSSTVASTILPAIAWQVFEDSLDPNDIFYANSFPWNSTDFENEVQFRNGTNATESKKIITLLRLDDVSIGAIPSATTYLRPKAYRVVTTGGVATTSDTITYDSSTDSGELTDINVFSSSTGFEDLTVAGKTLKQKTLKLCTELVIGPMNTSEGFQEDANSTSIYKAMNWDDANSGDPIGRYAIATVVSINQAAMIKAHSPTYNNSSSEAMMNTDYGTVGSLPTLSFILWAWVYPKFDRMIHNVSPNMKDITVYYTDNGYTIGDLSSMSGYTILPGDAVLDTHLDVLSQSLSIGSALSDANKSSIKYTYASSTSTDSGYYKRYPFNGDAVFKYERYFKDLNETTNVGGSPYTDAYGIIPGPRKVGRFSGGSLEKAWHQMTKFYKKDTLLNSSAATYECFFPIDFAIKNTESSYHIQLVNVCLDNEMINGPTGQMSLGDPSKMFDIANNQSGTTNFEVPISDEIYCPPAAPATTFTVQGLTLNTSTATVTIPNITVGSVTIVVGSKRINLGTNAAAAGIRVGQGVSSSTASALLNGRVVEGMSGNYIFINSGADEAATSQTLTFVSNASNIGIKTGQKVSLNSFISANTTVASTTNNTFVLSAVPAQNGSNKTLTFEWANKDYATWAIVRGKRGKTNSSITAFNRTPNNRQYWQKWSHNYVKPYQGNTYTTTSLWAAETWNATSVNVGALDFVAEGMLKPNVDGAFSTSSNDANSTLENSLVNTNVNYSGQSNESLSSGAPHIYFKIDRTKIESNNIDSAVFYNRLRVRYILHNKLDNYSANQKLITGQQFTENGKGHSFQTGGGTRAQVYESTFLVRANFTAALPTLIVNDLEGDTSTTINFGIVHSS